ncbi:hypothetical protein LCGC14_1451540 [marine sediment metagenome]|uniref:Uncharacterized protein n=1 Tax=marine sediment metagenome TaxID=412755 RepID=A0A0F9MJH9_9ZZZZ
MSVYTEAHFATCLLECGPHIQGTRAEGPYMAPHTQYRERVYRHFVIMFPDIASHTLATQRHITGAWPMFWREYIKWVES